MLQEVSVTILNNSDCMRAYSSPLVPRRNYPEGIIDSQMCAGDPNGGKDACQVDRTLLQNGESVKTNTFDLKEGTVWETGKNDILRNDTHFLLVLLS